MIERTPASHSEAGAFLSPGESQKLSALRFTKRRDEWLLGRRAAKSLVRSLPEYQDLDPTGIEIRNTSEGAPFLYLPDGQTLEGCLSISHSGPLAFCALTQDTALKVGVDLEKVEARSNDFAKDYFTPTELLVVASFPLDEQQTAITLIWSMKEAMLKALGIGLRWDTRQVEVRAISGLSGGRENPEAWNDVSVSDAQTKNRPWSAWWRRRGDFLMTIAGLAEFPKPVSILLVEQYA